MCVWGEWALGMCGVGVGWVCMWGVGVIFGWQHTSPDIVRSCFDALNNYN